MSTTRPSFALLSLASNLQRHTLPGGAPFYVLLLLTYPGTINPSAPQQYLRLALNIDPVSFDAGDGQGPQQYLPFNFDLGEIQQATSGQFPTVDLKVSNVMRVIQTLIESYNGIGGSSLQLFWVSPANPSGEPDLSLAFTVLNHETQGSQTVTLKLGASSPLRRLFPQFMYFANACQWRYKSAQCGYTGPLPTCSKTIDGPNGCQAHFPGQPLRALCFPGIDTAGIAGASQV